MLRITFVLTFCIAVCVSQPGCQKQTEETADAEEQQQPSSNDAAGAAGNVGQWASETWNGAVSGSSEALEGTGEWISDLYKSAKDTGVTSASSVKDWVADDWNAQGDFQYQILTLESDNVQQVQETLNKAGAHRWDCYHVEASDSSWTFFMKRKRRSYLSKVPLKDLANFLPLGGGDSDSGDSE